jgi:hypothetical protein
MVRNLGIGMKRPFKPAGRAKFKTGDLLVLDASHPKYIRPDGINSWMYYEATIVDAERVASRRELHATDLEWIEAHDICVVIDDTLAWLSAGLSSQFEPGIQNHEKNSRYYQVMVKGVLVWICEAFFKVL